MRILLTADPELPVPPRLYGGIERIIALLVYGFLALGHEVALVANADSTSKPTRFFSWPGRSSRSKSWENAMALRAAVKSFEPDVIHSFSRLLWLLPLVLDPRPKIMSYQREPTGRAVCLSNHLHRGRLIFTGCSEYLCRNGRQRGGGEWTVVPNAVDLESYTFQPQVAADAPLVFLSRIEAIKGCHNAIEIAKRTRRRLAIAGNHADEGVNGAYWRERILPEIGRNGIEYVGEVNDEQKDQLLGRAAALLVPIEWNEPFGIVFIEALACGTPVISCPLGALPEIVRDSTDGFLIGSIEEGCLAVEKLASLDRAQCRERAETNFSGRVIARQYLTLYQRLVNQ
jgi:glycosyltransferase involved in cell wall biosynthesis